MTPAMQSLTFLNLGSKVVDFPYNDSLIITLWMDRHEVNRVLIELGFGVKVIFIYAIQWIGIPAKGLIPLKILLWDLGCRAIDHREFGSYSQYSTYLPPKSLQVVDAPSPYNAIMGRGWFQSLQAVPSTFHLILRKLSLQGVREVKGNQWQARRCEESILWWRPKNYFLQTKIKEWCQKEEVMRS